MNSAGKDGELRFETVRLLSNPRLLYAGVVAKTGEAVSQFEPSLVGSRSEPDIRYQ